MTLMSLSADAQAAYTRRVATLLELVLCLTLRDQVIHPTTSYENPDPECDLDYVPNEAREAKVDVAMANACGFGGINSSIVVSRWGALE